MDIITYGGGEFVRDVLNGVAALVGTGAFGSALRLTLLLGLLFTLFQVALNQSPMVMIRWFVTTLIIYLCLLVPKTTVTVIDRYDPALTSPVVANVPLGLAAIASFTTTVGDEFTDFTETAFSLPSDLEYQENGFIYGSKVLRDAMAFEVTDSQFARNLSTYIRTCVFYDILDNQISVTELRETADLWGLITTSPNPARSMPYTTGVGASAIVTCETAATNLDGLWTTEANRIAGIYGQRVAPNLSEAAARTLVLSSLVSSHDFFLGSSRAAEDTIRQAALANMFNKALRDEGAELDADALIDAYASARSDAETASAYEQLSRLAGRFVPIFRTVAEVVFYGLFPILFPIFLLPAAGLRMMKGYFWGFVALMAWGPLYVILHRIMMGAGEYATLGASYTPTSGNALTMVTQSSIAGVHGDIATIAGYLTLLIPFAANQLGKGAMAFAGLAQTTLHPAQHAAQSAAREATTGNMSLGNTSFDNHSWANATANRVATSGFSDTGEGSWNTPGGGRMKVAGDGRRVVDTSGAATRGFTGIDYSAALQTALQSEAGIAQERRETAALRSQNGVSALSHRMTEAAFQIQRGTSFEDATGFSEDTRTGRAISESISEANRFASRFTDADEQAWAREAYVAASIEKEFGVPVPLTPKAKVSAGGRISGSESGRFSDIAEQAKEAVQTSTSTRDMSDLDTTFDRDAVTDSSSRGGSWREGFAANYQEVMSASADAELAQSRADSARELASWVARDGSSINQNLGPAFFEYVAASDRGDGSARGYEEARRIMESADFNDARELRALGRTFVADEAQELLERPDLADWRSPETGDLPAPYTEADVIARSTNNRAIAGSWRRNPPDGHDYPYFDERGADDVFASVEERDAYVRQIMEAEEARIQQQAADAERLAAERMGEEVEPETRSEPMYGPHRLPEGMSFRRAFKDGM